MERFSQLCLQLSSGSAAERNAAASEMERVTDVGAVAAALTASNASPVVQFHSLRVLR